MAINPIPVTFHLTADLRPELIDAQRRRARPYRIIVQAVGLMTAMAVAFGYFAGAVLPPQNASAPVAQSPATQSPAAHAPVRAAAAAPPSFEVWRPQAQTETRSGSPAPVRQILAEQPAPAADFTPVAAIPESSEARMDAFAEVERAPGYEGFKVIAGQ